MSSAGGHDSDWLSVEGGTFDIGFNEAEIETVQSSFPMIGKSWFAAAPALKVQLGPFELQKTAVTTAQYTDFLNACGNSQKDGVSYYFEDGPFAQIERLNGQYVPKAEVRDHPVTGISYAGARAYADWLGDVRLASPYEWEVAARAAAADLGHDFSTGVANTLNHWDAEPLPPERNVLQEGRGTVPVDAFARPQSRWLNLCGNCWEWCEGEFGGVLKGGSWNDIFPLAFHPALSHKPPASYPTTHFFGLRLARGSALPKVLTRPPNPTSPGGAACQGRLRGVRQGIIDFVMAQPAEMLSTEPFDYPWSANDVLAHLVLSEVHFINEIARGTGRAGISHLDVEPVRRNALQHYYERRNITLDFLEDLAPAEWSVEINACSHPFLAGRPVEQIVDFMAYHEWRHGQEIVHLTESAQAMS